LTQLLWIKFSRSSGQPAVARGLRFAPPVRLETLDDLMQRFGDLMKKVPIIIIILFFNFIFAGICSAGEDEACGDPCGKPTAWAEFNVVTLKMTVPNAPGYAIWDSKFDKETFDIQVDVEISDGKEIKKGKILMVGGRVMATQGPVTEPGYEIDALDAAILQHQLVVRMLGESLPNGPADIKGVKSIDFIKTKTGIQFATPSAQGFIAPPWTVKGGIKVQANDIVEYSLLLTSGTKGKPADQGGEYSAQFDGKLSKIESAKISDALPLEGWKLYGVGVQTRKEGNATAYDYGAAPATTAYKSIADIRKKLAQDNYPGEPDPSKDFTGFWKEKCEETFGLQIMPYGTDGKYSIIFCGQGGCGKQGSDGRNSFITKDKNYEVISEDKIKIRRSDGWDTYDLSPHI
jgi:hypothetical protein